MSVWAIGDLQGCYDVTQRLLEKIRFDPAQDTLWFCGDRSTAVASRWKRCGWCIRCAGTAWWCWATMTFRCWPSVHAPKRNSARSIRPAAHRAGRGPRRTAGLAAPAEAGARGSRAGLDDGARRPGTEVDHADGRKACRRGRGATARCRLPQAVPQHVRRQAELGAEPVRLRPFTGDHQCAHPHALLHRAGASASRTRARRARRNRDCTLGSKCRAGSSAT